MHFTYKELAEFLYVNEIGRMLHYKMRFNHTIFSKVFAEMPNYAKRYSDMHFWGGQYSNSSVGFANEETIKNYIRRQDVSYEPFPQREEDVHQMRLFT